MFFFFFNSIGCTDWELCCNWITCIIIFHKIAHIFALRCIFSPCMYTAPICICVPGITGILMSAAGLPVCLTRPPKLVLHPPPVSKSDIKPIPGLGHCCRKTSKKQARKGKAQHMHTNKFHIHTDYNFVYSITK